MNEGQAATLAALDSGALTAVAIGERVGLPREQVGEHLLALAHIGFVRGNTARPRLWAMTGLARDWTAATITPVAGVKA
jgi:hypothetical protein